jgi:hypothetical protein
MSASSLPKYSSVPPYPHSPSYYPEPPNDGYRTAAQGTVRAADYVKTSKSGSVTLRLLDQESSNELPIYGCGAVVEG